MCALFHSPFVFIHNRPSFNSSLNCLTPHHYQPPSPLTQFTPLPIPLPPPLPFSEKRCSKKEYSSNLSHISEINVKFVFLSPLHFSKLPKSDSDRWNSPLVLTPGMSRDLKSSNIWSNVSPFSGASFGTCFQKKPGLISPEGTMGPLDEVFRRCSVMKFRIFFPPSIKCVSLMAMISLKNRRMVYWRTLRSNCLLLPY